MTPVEIWLAIAAFFGATLGSIAYYRNSGTSLEVRVNSIVKEKREIITKSYEELIEKVFEAFKTERKLKTEHKEEFEKIAYISSQLDDLPDSLSEVVDRLTNSFIFGFASILTILLLAYLPSAGFDAFTLFLAQFLTLMFMTVFIYRYITDGIIQIKALRKREKLINAIDRCDTFKKLYELGQ
jgi:ABC-type multidrug transport system fused ATPase/permease subunit